MKEKINRIIKTCLEDEVDLKVEWKRLMEKIDTQPSARPGKKDRWITGLKYAAAVGIGILLSISAEGLIPPKLSPQKNIAHYVLQTEKGEKSQIELPDGTKIWLNSFTTIEYEPSYGINNRTIHLIGEAHFDVAKNKDLPFIVKSQGIEIKALGTSFNVSAYSEDARLVTTLYQGQVSVYSSQSRQKALLSPNQTAVYYKDQGKLEKRSSKEYLKNQWRNGLTAFEMMPLPEVTKMLERNYNVVFCYQNPEKRQIRLSGSFREQETIQEIMKVIKVNTSISYQIKGDTVLLK